MIVICNNEGQLKDISISISALRDMSKHGLKLVSLFVLSFCGFSAVQVERGLDDEDFVIDLSDFGPKLFGNPVENSEDNLNTDENPEERGVYLEGDLLIPEDGRSGMKAESYRWKKGEVPFEIRGDFSEFLGLEVAVLSA
jgi:hypothetical protein